MASHGVSWMALPANRSWPLTGRDGRSIYLNRAYRHMHNFAVGDALAHYI